MTTIFEAILAAIVIVGGVGVIAVMSAFIVIFVKNVWNKHS